MNNDELHARIERLETDLLDANALLAVDRMLIEVVYANAFAENPDGFRAVMAALQRLTRESPARAEPVSDEAMVEFQARCAAYLQRIESSVLDRIARPGRTGG